MAVADADHGVGFEAAQLAGAQAGAGQQLDHEPIAGIDRGSGGGHDPGCVAIVEELGQRFRSGRQVSADDRVAHRRVGPVPLDDPLEERPQGPQPLALRVGRQPRAGLVAGLGGEPHLVVRMLVVPATMELLGERNWWFPRWLDRRLPRLHVEGGPSAGPPPGPRDPAADPALEPVGSTR